MKLQHQILTIISDLCSNDWIKFLSKDSNIYIVGGAVRDAFLNKQIKDVDIIVEGLSLETIAKKLSPFGKVSLVGESFAVIKFKPNNENDYIDIAVPRIDRKISSGHKGFSIETNNVSITDDLKRRDFTVNSIAINTITKEVIDPFNGISDLNKGLLRATDSTAFIEDPLRIFRGIQFAARFNFSVEKETLKLMKQNAFLIKEIAPERILDELNKILLKGGNVSIALNLINETSIDLYLIGNNIGNFENLDKLDIISFYYIIGLNSNKKPHIFYKENLKGEYKVEKEIEALDKLFEISININKDDVKYQVFKISNSFPSVLNCELLPIDLLPIIKDIKSGKIPSSIKDIKLSGDDVIKYLKIRDGKTIGSILNRIYRDALDNKYNWKDRIKCLEYLFKEFLK